MSVSYEPRGVKVHTALCYVEGFDPICVAPKNVRDVSHTDSLPNQCVSDMRVKGGATTVVDPHVTLHSQVFCGSGNTQVKRHSAGCSQAFYDASPQTVSTQTSLGRYVKGSTVVKRLPAALCGAARVRLGSFLHTMLHPTHTTVISVTSRYATWSRLNNLFSCGSFAVLVKSTLRPAVAQTLYFVIRTAPVVGRYSDVLLIPSGMADIAGTSELYGLRVGPDKRSIGGIVSFTFNRRIDVVLGDGAKIELHIEPTLIERIA